MSVETSEPGAPGARFPDLDGAPFTLARSRLLVSRVARADGGAGTVTETAVTDALTIRAAEYERDLSDCVVVERLRVCAPDGTALPVTEVRPDRIVFGARVALTFAGPGALSIGALGSSAQGDAGWSLELRAPDGVDIADDGWRLGLPSVPELRWCAPGLVVRRSADEVVLRTADACGILLRAGGDPERLGHHAHLEATAAVWRDWFDRCPVVRGDLQSMTRDCWWVLGANIVELPGQGNARAVVPSKIGYVGVWQWDAYFIAAGLRHGDPELAREQLDLALRFPGGDGQLPDVVHDDGVLASSDDLPPADLERLRRHGSAAADPSVRVALTKPPLTAWAIAKVAEKLPDAGWEAAAYAVAARSQDWWFEHQDSDGDGMPEYSHPYSSGLDDSPIFDGELPVASPDLAAYLIVQDDLLARHFARLGESAWAASHRRRAERTLGLLLTGWDDERGFFPAFAAGTAEAVYAAVSLLPLLTGRLPEPIRERMVAALHDPALFAARYAVPTVALSDPAFDAERMWRGPTWLNINVLVMEGLRAVGETESARALAEDTVRLVIEAGGPHEYFNPETGRKARTATTAFGWSAALFVELAVALSV